MSRLVKKAEENICSLSALLKTEDETATGRQAVAATAEASSAPLPLPPAAAAALEDATAAAAVPAAADHAAAHLTGEPSTSGRQHHHHKQEQQEQQQQHHVAGGIEAFPELCGTESVFQRTALALETWDTLASTASTPSTLLPSGHSQELMRQLRLRQRWSKLVSGGAAGCRTASAATGAAPATSSAAGGGGGEREEAAAAPPAVVAADGSVSKRRRVAVDGDSSDVSSVEHSFQGQQREQGAGRGGVSKGHVVEQQDQQELMREDEGERGSGQKRMVSLGGWALLHHGTSGISRVAVHRTRKLSHASVNGRIAI